MDHLRRSWTDDIPNVVETVEQVIGKYNHFTTILTKGIRKGMVMDSVLDSSSRFLSGWYEDEYILKWGPLIADHNTKQM